MYQCKLGQNPSIGSEGNVQKKSYADADNLSSNPKGGGDIIKSEKLKGIQEKRIQHGCKGRPKDVIPCLGLFVLDQKNVFFSGKCFNIFKDGWVSNFL